MLLKLREVIDYIRGQLNVKFDQNIPIYPYSTRPGFERFKHDLDDQFLRQVAIDIEARSAARFQNANSRRFSSDCQ